LKPLFSAYLLEARDYMEIGLREWLIVIGIIVIAGAVCAAARAS
jgi:cell division protein ZipA